MENHPDQSAAEIAQFKDLGASMLRWGGNQVSRYNWEINASNSGVDWYFANVSYGWPDAPPGRAADNFVRAAQSVGAASLLTVPAIGFVAKDGDNANRSKNVPKDGGPPLQPGSEAISGYDPSANQQATSIKSFAAKGQPFADPPDLQDGAVYQDEWVNHLVSTFGPADAGGVRFYAIDNEPELWSNSHTDVHPVRMGYDSMLATFLEYATAIKAVDPSAQILAPDVSGVTGLVFSELDRGDDNFLKHDDRTLHGNVPFIAWFLDQIRRHDQQTGHRTLDVLSVHNYPGANIEPNGVDPASNALRLRATQQLWNPRYTDESWVKYTETPQLTLIPRLHDWINTYYPGTKIGISEWRYGAADSINGGLTIVDVLGIFGREGVDMAGYWTFPKAGTPGASAFKLYRNYDNCGHQFGDQYLAAESSDEKAISAFASRDSSSGNILVMMVNKLPDRAVGAHITLEGLATGQSQVFQFSAQQTAIHRQADGQVVNGKLQYTLAPYSATLFVIKP